MNRAWNERQMSWRYFGLTSWRREKRTLVGSCFFRSGYTGPCTGRPTVQVFSFYFSKRHCRVSKTVRTWSPQNRSNIARMASPKYELDCLRLLATFASIRLLAAELRSSSGICIIQPGRYSHHVGQIQIDGMQHSCFLLGTSSL